MSAVVEESTATEGAAHAPVLSVEHLVKDFNVRSTQGARTVKRTVQAVSDVSFSIGAGQTLGLVGESGSGKSTVGRCVLRLIVADRRARCKFRRHRAHHPRQGASCAGCRREMQIVFQDPYASLDPRMTIGSDRRRSAVDPQGARRSTATRVEELLALVGLNPEHAQPLPARVLGRSAPARRRRPCARARPLVAGARRARLRARRVDPGRRREPARGPARAARARVPLHRARPLGGAAHLRHRRGHVPRQDRRDGVVGGSLQQGGASVHAGVALGRARSESETGAPAQAHRPEGDVPSPIDPPSGCRFRTRCWKAQEICATEEPALVDRGQGHPVACHFAEIAAEIV